jgi:catechol 2,3-dioxygenase-like lactoylglutathione lyase family enzyme
MAACFRYIVNDVSAAIDFYTRNLGFKVEMHPAPGFAEISRGDMHLYLTQPQGHGVGGGAPMPSGEQQTPGGWNRALPQRGRARCGRQANLAGRSIGKSRRAV